MKIYEVLKMEHREVQALLRRLHTAAPAERGALRSRLLDDLTSHAIAEETILYDRMADALKGKDREVVFEAREEHRMLTLMLEDLALCRLEDERFSAKVKTIIELVEHHVKEEEGEVFARAQRMFDDVIAENFAGEYIAERREVMRAPLVVRLGKARAKRAIEHVGAMLRPASSAPEAQHRR